MANQQVKCNGQVFYFSPIVVDLNKSNEVNCAAPD